MTTSLDDKSRWTEFYARAARLEAEFSSTIAILIENGSFDDFIIWLIAVTTAIAKQCGKLKTTEETIFTAKLLDAFTIATEAQLFISMAKLTTPPTND
jgi:hypothetical protein